MDAFAALADPVRRDLLRRLAPGPARVVDLAAEHPISRPAISRHLRLLTEAGLADRRGPRPRAALPARPRRARARAGPARPSSPPSTPPIAERMLDGLDLEVRRTGRDRRATAPTHQEETG